MIFYKKYTSRYKRILFLKIDNLIKRVEKIEGMIFAGVSYIYETPAKIEHFIVKKIRELLGLVSDKNKQKQ